MARERPQQDHRSCGNRRQRAAHQGWDRNPGLVGHVGSNVPQKESTGILASSLAFFGVGTVYVGPLNIPRRPSPT